MLWIPRIFSKWLWSYCAKDNIWLIYSVVVIMNMDSKKKWFPLICLSFFSLFVFFFYVVFVTSSNFASSCSAINESLTLANIITGPRRRKKMKIQKLLWNGIFPSISYYFQIPKIFLNFFPHTGKNRNRQKSWDLETGCRKNQKILFQNHFWTFIFFF